MSTKWISAEAVRVDDRGGVAIEGLTFASDGPHLAIIGGPSILAHALAGTTPLARGTILLDGKMPHEAMLAGDVAHAPRDPRTPDEWTPRTLISWSARLMGMNGAEARTSANHAITKLGLTEMADRKLATLPLGAKRATSIAAALATKATTLVIDDPSPGLTDDAARTLERIAADALDDVKWILLTGRLSLASPFGLRADDAVLLGPEGVVAHGAPAEVAAKDRVYALRVVGPAQALADLVRARGATASAKDRELEVELSADMTTRDLFSMASEASVTIVSLRPIANGVA